MGFFRSAEGLLTLRLTSAEPEAALGRINGEGIALHCLEMEDLLTCRFQIRRKEFHRLKSIVQSRGEKLEILSRGGLFWTLLSLRRRPVLVLGMVLVIFLWLYLPTRVLFVRVEGNESIPQRRILEAAENCGIRFFSSRKEVRSEQMKNALLSAVPELQWAGVNTSGCTAVISVREKQAEPSPETAGTVSHIAALRDGYVLSATATEGSLLVKPGDVVKAGQTLISGYTDCGICIRAEAAQGEIYARTMRPLEVVAPEEWRQTTETGEVKRSYSLLFEKKRINLWKESGISHGTCGRMYEEYYITLPGGFRLPVALCVETFVIRETTPVQTAPEEVFASLAEYAQSYLLTQMVAGSIRGSENTGKTENGLHRLSGAYVCNEMIGRVQWEQIGEIHGKDD